MCTQSSMVSHSHLRVCEGGRVGEFEFVCVRASACVYVRQSATGSHTQLYVRGIVYLCYRNV